MSTMKDCSIPLCPRPARARGWCRLHYNRWLTHGDPMMVRKGGVKPTDPAPRFWAKVTKTETCWIWNGAKASKYGHGKFGKMKAHRWAYEDAIGPIPEGLTIDHLCRVPACVNPAHLEPVTLAENLRRQGAAKTHCPQGHPLSGPNLYRDPSGFRHCRICRKAADRRRKAKLSGVRTPQR